MKIFLLSKSNNLYSFILKGYPKQTHPRVKFEPPIYKGSCKGLKTENFELRIYRFGFEKNFKRTFVF